MSRSMTVTSTKSHAFRLFCQSVSSSWSRASHSLNLLDLLGRGQHELVALLLASARHLDLHRLIFRGVAEPEALVSIIGQLAGKVVRGLLAVRGDDHGVLAFLGVLVLQAALGTKSVTLDGDGLAAIIGSQ